ncbi:hypothetical protein [Elizabethkingia anophelis]|uniref:hypothetical protein n=1 Tax=Elizabethkingia anophelis TaxID=1117645 RepID=UPI0013167F0D|nr:hypothetical protein [Elizabethkingia anophelis]MBE9393727.1 hypothetical protein [Elizabethkingia anophelis]MBE9405672.1 hypothetical protein [Elizabethkingia anophelis]MCT4314850.1 hypothetical protein [Elizabethkingia anophelis]BBQ07573.1 hypothetical protein JUNP353_2144 [Elizabethkingia anophelis]
MDQKVRINGKYRNYGSVRVSALGATFVGVGKIEYKREDAIDPVKAVGTTKSIGYTQGDETNEGSISLVSETVDAMQAKLPPGKTLPDIPPFPITVSYVDDFGIQVCHVLYGCKFKANGRSAEAGNNGAIFVEIPLYIHDIDFAA